MTHSFPTRRASDLSAEQLAKEGSPIDGAWGIVGCLYTAEPEEIPMAPITMMRNALGVEEGGSGVPLDRDAYRRSVEFWERNANWRRSEEHTSELQSLMRISYAVFCLKKKKT